MTINPLHAEEIAKALSLAERALKMAEAADLDRWADIGPCPVYHGEHPNECTCEEEVRRIGVRNAFRAALDALAKVKGRT